MQRIAKYVVPALFFLVPVFFIPSAYHSVEFSKSSLIIVGVILALLAYMAVSFRAVFFSQNSDQTQGSLIQGMPKSILWSLGILSASIIASALYSPTIMKSFFGQGFEVNTASFLLAIILAIVVAFIYARTEIKNIFVLYASLISTFAIIALFVLIRLVFGPDTLDFGVFQSLTSTPLGQWFDIGAFSAIVFLIAYSALLKLGIDGKSRMWTWVVSILAIVPLIVINSLSVWVVFAIVLAIAIAYSYFSSNIGSKRIPWMLVIPFVLALLFVFKGDIVSNKINNAIGTGYVEVGLSWRSTLDVVTGSIKASPLLGIGENRFSQAYTTFKPSAINETNLWDLEFPRGFSWISTFVATQGIVGLVAWIIFFATFGYLGHKAMRTKFDQPAHSFVVYSSYLGSVFMWLLTLFYAPSHAMLFVTAGLTGIFLASLVHVGLTGNQFGTSNKLWVKIVYILVVIALIVWAVFGLRKIIGMTYFKAGVKDMNIENNLEGADASFVKAIASDPNNNLYWQARAEVAIAKVRTLVASVNAQTPASTSQAIALEAGNLINSAISYTDNAIKSDPLNYYNYVSKARVGEVGSALNMENADQVVADSYQQAIDLNPTNPAIYLSFARFLASREAYEQAIQAVGASLNVKSNYVDAIYLLSQIQATTGDLKNAIASAKVAVQLNPENPLLQFQLGLLEYNNTTYSNAVEALEKAVALEQGYDNAKYFLGLAYARLGRDAEAITIFEKLSEAYPQNSEIRAIFDGLVADKDIFRTQQVQNATKSPTLPIDEE